jgi:hypothetical protein
MGLADSRPGANKLPLEELWRALFHFFRDHGYLGRPRRDAPAGTRSSDGDWGVCFVLDTVGHARQLQGLLRQAAYPPEEVFRRHGKWLVHLPGREAVELVSELWAESNRRLSGKRRE